MVFVEHSEPNSGGIQGQISVINNILLLNICHVGIASWLKADQKFFYFM